MAYLGGLGSNNTRTAGSTLAITASSTIPAGTVLILAIGWDNIDATTPTISSVSAAGGGTWTSRGTANSGVSATAGSGIYTAVYTTTTTSQINSAATITTITWSSASTASRSAAIVGHSNQLESLRGAVISNPNTAGTPSAVTTTAPVTGDVVIGVVIGEDNSTPTADADTLNGSWSAIYGTASTGGNANTNIAVGIQSKTVTAGGNQTYNPTTANDSVAFVFTLATPLAATFNNGSNTSTTTGSFTPTITYVPIITGQSNSTNPPAQTSIALGILTTATASGQSVSSGSLPDILLVNTFVLSGQSNSSGSLVTGLIIKETASGQSNSSGTFTPTIAYVPTMTGQSNTFGGADIYSMIRSTASGLSTTTGSLAAFRAVGATMSGQSNSTGAASIVSLIYPIISGQSNTTGSFAPVFTFQPIISGQSNATGSFKVGIDSPGTSTAFSFTYGSAAIGLTIRNNTASGQSNSSGSVNGDFAVSTTFIGWGSPL